MASESSRAPRQPKVLMFDIGGVCVNSPFQAILDYEVSLGIPPGWVNYSLSRTAPNGWWHRLERGEVPMDESFFRGFNEDLHHEGRWREFYAREQQKSKGEDRARLQRQEKGEAEKREDEASDNRDLHARPESDTPPPLPKMDGEWLFNEMMAYSAAPDPWMYPALKALKASGRYILAALSNTVIFPPGHRLHKPDFLGDPVRGIFDVFISSAHVGLRKPDARIYQLALDRVDRFAREQRGAGGRSSAITDDGDGMDDGVEGQGVEPEDVVFLDDIGENLKHARKQGFRTIKVHLGRAYEAVDQLESLTGLALAGAHPRVPPQLPVNPKSKM
ncbi:to epoxide hydrolase [Geosmithia morbida]|uniref:To epoxide hydrolase n=1 Tax=Geosmithia morbida TaxID=1094350 RepID=A0A9P5CZ06_9HYPO|nr:to epoxide hydrolase [Geosmithia morbida]KAF4121038.1 to epoxide hydrolase [Geosmithia morbida]